MCARLLSLLITLFCCIGLGACTEPQEKPLRLGTNLWLGYEPFYLARGQDALERSKVRLIEYTTSLPVIDAMRSGLLDAAALTLDESIVLQQQVHDLRVIAVLDFSYGADALLGKPEITSIADLRGKRVGVENLATGGYLLARGLASAGLSYQDVEIVPINADHHQKALHQPDIAAIVSYQPMLTHLLNGGAHRLFDSSQIPGEIIDLLVVRERTLQEHRSHLPYLLRAWFIGRQHMLTQQPQALAQMQARQQLTTVQLKQTLNELRFPTHEENLRLLGPRSTLQSTSRQLQAHLQHAGLLPSSPPIQPLRFDPAWLQDTPR